MFPFFRCSVAITVLSLLAYGKVWRWGGPHRQGTARRYQRTQLPFVRARHGVPPQSGRRHPRSRHRARLGLDAFKAGKEVDVLTASPFSNVQGPDKQFTALVEAALKHNPNMRIVVQVSWLGSDDAKNQTKPEPRPTGTPPPSSFFRRSTNRISRTCASRCRRINDKHGKQVIFLVPVAQATIALRERKSSPARRRGSRSRRSSFATRAAMRWRRCRRSPATAIMRSFIAARRSGCRITGRSSRPTIPPGRGSSIGSCRSWRGTL